MFKSYKMHSHRELILKIVFLLILPFILVSFFLVLNLYSSAKKTVESNIKYFVREVENLKESHINTIMQRSVLMANNDELKGIALFDYNSSNSVYYLNIIRSFFSKSFNMTDSLYINKVYMVNPTIPRGFGFLYNLDDLGDFDIVKEFMESDQTELWIQPYEVEGLASNTFTPYEDHYTYLKKSYVGDDLLYVSTISIHKNHMDGILYDNYDLLFSNRPQIKYLQENIVVDFNLNKLELPNHSDEIADWVEETAHKGYITYVLDFEKLNQSFIFIWGKNKYLGYINAMIAIMLAFSIISIYIVIRYINMIFKRLFVCLDNLESSVKSGEFLSKELDNKRNGKLFELDKIHSIYNVLVGKIQDLINLSSKQGILLKETQIAALQYQINPHFLYNTLEVFSYKMEKYQHYVEADAMVSFSEMLRYNLQDGSIFGSLYDELQHVRNYINIQAIKYNNISYEVKVLDEMMEYEMLKFILQPIVENCLAHGYHGDHFKITIESIDDEEQFWIKIRDNGVGIKEEDIKRITQEMKTVDFNNGNSIGLKNINSRLNLIYSTHLLIESNPEGGTCISIQIPK